MNIYKQYHEISVYKLLNHQLDEGRLVKFLFTKWPGIEWLLKFLVSEVY